MIVIINIVIMIILIIVIIIIIIIIIIVIITAHVEIHGAFHDSRVFPQVTADAAQVKARGRPTSSATAGGRTSRRGSPGVPRIRRKMGEKPYWLVVWNMFSIHWEKSSQLTFVFSLRGWIHQRRIRSLDGFIWLLDDFDQVISWIFYKDVKATKTFGFSAPAAWRWLVPSYARTSGQGAKGPRPDQHPPKQQRCGQSSGKSTISNVAQFHLHHPPVITISIGAMFTVPRHGWFMTLFQPHQMMFGTSWYFSWGFPKINVSSLARYFWLYGICTLDTTFWTCLCDSRVVHNILGQRHAETLFVAGGFR